MVTKLIIIHAVLIGLAAIAWRKWQAQTKLKSKLLDEYDYIVGMLTMIVNTITELGFVSKVQN